MSFASYQVFRFAVRGPTERVVIKDYIVGLIWIIFVPRDCQSVNI